jgi:hypothetical protein
MEPLRGSGEAFDPTEYVTMPLPVPLVPLTTVTQLLVLVAVHAQVVRTEKVPADPPIGTVAEGGDRV